ncbi:histidine kinase [Collinsella tanakaei]|uniref:sensor histidine kinase n=1 Tax=Collinsella tanakaei TaxID=626935 RepID=UPI0025A317CF|nr:histidine kinase [Collinsella tanakaei]MDM8246337.1 histidine kinase [Collinsella tanakaei]
MGGIPHPIRWSRRLNPTKVMRSSKVAMTALLGLCVPLLLLMLVWDLMDNPHPVPAVVTIAGLVLLCFFFSYVFVVPDDLTSSATDRTLSIASKIFVHTRHGMTPEAALGACQIILPETLASAICITDGRQVLACWGEGSDRCPAGTPVTLETTRRVIESGSMSVFSRDGASTEEMRYFPRLRAGVVAPLTVRGRCVGTFELFYPRFAQIDMRQTALATGFADLISTQLASFELERQDELTARMELRALQSQVDPHFLFNTIGTIVSLVRTEPEKARSLLIDFSNYYRQTLSDSDTLTTLEHELEQGVRYINLMQARYGADRLHMRLDVDHGIFDRRVPPFVLQPLLENCIKHAMREVEPLSIIVSARATKAGIELAVADDGIGMSDEVRMHLFDPRDAAADEPETLTADGSVKRGCGLALSNVLMRIRFFFGEESGIHVESVEGVGTRVVVELVGEPHEPSQATSKIPQAR